MPRKRKNLTLEELKISCRDCKLTDLCIPHGLSDEELGKLDAIVLRKHPYQPGEHLFRPGDKGHALYAVRSGSLKTYCLTEDGEEQVLGFTLPGELVGLDGLQGGCYHSASVALETSSICELPFDSLEDLCGQLPAMNRQIMQLTGKEITSGQHMLMLLGKRSAEERLASFLLSLSMRYEERGLSATAFNLSMSRQDIGNYLGLAIETVSRLFAHMQEEKILIVSRRQITILDLDRLKKMVEACIQDSIATSM